MSNLVSSVTTKLNGRGVEFEKFFYNSSPLMKAIFYDWASLRNPSDGVSPKMVETYKTLLDDGRTVRWRDEDLRRNFGTLSASASAAATEIVMQAGEGSLYRVGDNIYLPAYGQTHVITGISTDTLTITPAVPAGDYASGSSVKVVSSAIDIAGGVDGKTVDLSLNDEQTNYLQHCSKQVQFTQVELNKVLTMYTRNGVDEKQAVKTYVNEKLSQGLREIQQDIVNAFYFGNKVQVTISGKSYDYAGGISEYISGTTDCSGTNDKTRLLNVIEAISGMNRVATLDGEYANILVCTEKAKSRLQALAGQFTTGETITTVDKLGFRVDVIRTNYGDIPVMCDPILTTYTENANFGYVLNPRLIQLISSVFVPSNKSNGKNDKEATLPCSGIMFHKDESAAKQANSPTVINLYTNFSFCFKGSSVTSEGSFYKKLTGIGE